MNNTLTFLCTILLSIALSCSTPTTSQSNAPAPASTLKPFAAGIITGEDYGVALSPDEKTMFFARRIDSRRSAHLYFSQLENGKWSTPQVAPFSGQFFDVEPFFSYDGTKLFFASKRPLSGTTPRSDFNLWVVEKTGNDWGTPKDLGDVNSNGNDTYPSVTKDGTLYLGSTREGGQGGVDLYRARFENGKYLAPENLGPLNTPSSDADPFIAPDESYLIFASSRPGGLGEGDLYVTFRRGNEWTTPRSLGPTVNSPEWDYAQSVSRDGRTMYFSRGWGGAFAIDIKELDLTPR